jgi:hypothetical protein
MSKRNAVAAMDEVAPTEAAPTEAAPLDGEIIKPSNIPPVGQRRHRATFASDNLKGGYMIRVEGPDSDRFSKREVPVTRFDHTETVVKCDKLVWTGPDKETGAKITLYKFVAHPRAAKEVEQISF